MERSKGQFVSWQPLFVIAIFFGVFFFFVSTTDFVKEGGGDVIRKRSEIPACQRQVRESMVLADFSGQNWEDRASTFENVELFDAGLFAKDGLRLRSDKEGTWESEKTIFNPVANLTRLRLDGLNTSRNSTITLFTRIGDEKNFTREATFNGEDGRFNFFFTFRNESQLTDVGSMFIKLEFNRDTESFDKPEIAELLVVGSFRENTPKSQIGCTFAVVSDYAGLIFFETDNPIFGIIINSFIIIMVIVVMLLVKELISALPFFGG